MSARPLPPLVHVRAPGAQRASVPPGTPAPLPEDVSGRAVPVDILRRDLVSGVLPRDTEVLFAGLGDWTPAHRIPELWTPATTPATDSAEPPVDSSGESARPLGDAPTAPPRRRGLGLGTVIAAVAAAVALLCFGAAAIYLVYFHYRPVAVQHLPRKCIAAARVDFIDWFFFSPFREKIVPAIEEATKPKPPIVATAPGGPSLKERLRMHAGIDVGRDLREVAVCVVLDTEPRPAGVPADPLFGFRPVIALGGRMRPGSIAGLYEAVRTEGVAADLGVRLEGAGESAVIRVSWPFPGVIGQADDGTLLYAPSDALLAAAREQRPEEEARASTGLTGKGALEVVGEHFAFGYLFGASLSPSGPLDNDILEALRKVQVGHLGLELDRAPKITLGLEEKTDSDAKDAERAVRRLLELAQNEVGGWKRDWAGEHGALQGAHIVRDDTRVDFRVDFRFADLDRGAGELAAMIKDETSPLRTGVLGRLTGPAAMPSPTVKAPVPPPASGEHD